MDLLTFVTTNLFVALTLAIGITALVALELRQNWEVSDPLTPFIAFATAIVSMGAIGTICAMSPLKARPLVAGVLLLIVVVGTASFLLRNKTRTLRIARNLGVYAVIWLVSGWAALLFSAAPVHRPATMPDEPFVYHQWTGYSKIQALAGDYPADNVLPAFPAEYIARGISFSKERPIAPGQEVANRPILASLIYLPFRLIFSRDRSGTPVDLPKTQVLGTPYPDSSVLLSDENFGMFLGIGAFLNALVLVAAYSMLRIFAVKLPLLVLSFTAVPSLYVLIQNFFTWPKSAAAFFVIAALTAARFNRAAWLIGVFLGVAYWFHPYALVFLLSIELYALAQAVLGKGEHVRSKSALQKTSRITLARPTFEHFNPALSIALAFLIVVLPWFVWTAGVLHISSDLVAQNFSASSGALDIPKEAWVRVNNLSRLIFLDAFSGPFDVTALTRNLAVSLASPIGLIFYLLIPAMIVLKTRQEKLFIVSGVVLPTILLTLTFGKPAPLMLFGLQAVWPILLGGTSALAQDWFGRRTFLAILSAQCLFSLVILAARLHEVAPSSPISNAEAKSSAYMPAAPVRSEPPSGLPVFLLPEGWLDAPLVPSRVEITVDGAAKPAILAASPTKLIFENLVTTVPSALKVFAAIHPSVYEKTSGAVLRVMVVPHGRPLSEASTLNLLDLQPKSRIADRGWHEIKVPLKKSPIALDIVFDCGPADDGTTSGGWCVWGDPAIVPVPR